MNGFRSIEKQPSSTRTGSRLLNPYQRFHKTNRIIRESFNGAFLQTSVRHEQEKKNTVTRRGGKRLFIALSKTLSANREGEHISREPVTRDRLNHTKERKGENSEIRSPWVGYKEK